MNDRLHEGLVALATQASVPPLDVGAVTRAAGRRRTRAVLIAGTVALTLGAAAVLGTQSGSGGKQTEHIIVPPAVSPSPVVTPPPVVVSTPPAVPDRTVDQLQRQVQRLRLDAEHDLVVASTDNGVFRLRRVRVTGPGLAGDDLTPARMDPQDTFRDLALRDGRLWLMTGDCAMATMWVWISDDAGVSWSRHAGPSSPNCSAGSGALLRLDSTERATAFVTIGSLGETTRWTTADGGVTWQR